MNFTKIKLFVVILFFCEVVSSQQSPATPPALPATPAQEPAALPPDAKPKAMPLEPSRLLQDGEGFRKRYGSIPFPDIKLNFKDYFRPTPDAVRVKSFKTYIENSNNYCLAYAKIYRAFVEKTLKYGDLERYFDIQCESVPKFLADVGPYHEGAAKIDRVIEIKIDAAYMAFATSPGLTQLKRVRDSFAAYQASPLGILGISYYNQFFVMQLLTLAAFIMALVKLF